MDTKTNMLTVINDKYKLIDKIEVDVEQVKKLICDNILEDQPYNTIQIQHDLNILKMTNEKKINELHNDIVMVMCDKIKNILNNFKSVENNLPDAFIVTNHFKDVLGNIDKYQSYLHLFSDLLKIFNKNVKNLSIMFEFDRGNNNDITWYQYQRNKTITKTKENIQKYLVGHRQQAVPKQFNNPKNNFGSNVKMFLFYEKLYNNTIKNQEINHKSLGELLLNNTANVKVNNLVKVLLLYISLMKNKIINFDTEYNDPKSFVYWFNKTDSVQNTIQQYISNTLKHIYITKKLHVKVKYDPTKKEQLSAERKQLKNQTFNIRILLSSFKLIQDKNKFLSKYMEYFEERLFNLPEVNKKNEKYLLKVIEQSCNDKLELIGKMNNTIDALAINGKNNGYIYGLMRQQNYLNDMHNIAVAHGRVHGHEHKDNQQLPMFNVKLVKPIIINSEQKTNRNNYVLPDPVQQNINMFEKSYAKIHKKINWDMEKGTAIVKFTALNSSYYLEATTEQMIILNSFNTQTKTIQQIADETKIPVNKVETIAGNIIKIGIIIKVDDKLTYNKSFVSESKRLKLN